MKHLLLAVTLFILMGCSNPVSDPVAEHATRELATTSHAQAPVILAIPAEEYVNIGRFLQGEQVEFLQASTTPTDSGVVVYSTSGVPVVLGAP